MSKKVVMCSIIAALGGFLFGFDTVVISGAEQTHFQIQEFSFADCFLLRLLMSSRLHPYIAEPSFFHEYLLPVFQYLVIFLQCQLSVYPFHPNLNGF